MSWCPPRMGKIVPALNTVSAALNERLLAYGHASNTLLPDLAAAAPYRIVKARFDELRPLILSLLTESLDVRQLGSWCDFNPFDTEAKQLALCSDAAAFSCTPPRLIGDWQFIENCYHLLNDFIVWKSPVVFIGSRFAPTFLDNKVAMEYDWVKIDYETGERTSGTSAGNSRDSSTQQVHYEANEYLYRQSNEHLRCGSGPPALHGTWKMQCLPSCYYDGRDERRSYAGVLQELTMTDGISTPIAWPVSEAWISGKINDPDISWFELQKSPGIRKKALLTRANLPQPTYQYRDEISL